MESGFLSRRFLMTSGIQNVKSRLSRVPKWIWAAGLVFVCLVPFVNKAFHIDDPLFLWTAQQIRHAAGDFYGFRLNWFGLEMPMTDATANPPLMGYFLAAGKYPINGIFSQRDRFWAGGMEFGCIFGRCCRRLRWRLAYLRWPTISLVMLSWRSHLQY